MGIRLASPRHRVSHLRAQAPVPGCARCLRLGLLLLYYERGNPGAVICPDVFLVRGVPKGARRTYKLWEEVRAQLVIAPDLATGSADSALGAHLHCRGGERP